MAEDEFAAHRKQLERILDLIDEHELSETDRDKIRLFVAGQRLLGLTIRGRRSSRNVWSRAYRRLSATWASAFTNFAH